MRITPEMHAMAAQRGLVLAKYNSRTYYVVNVIGTQAQFVPKPAIVFTHGDVVFGPAPLLACIEHLRMHAVQVTPSPPT